MVVKLKEWTLVVVGLALGKETKDDGVNIVKEALVRIVDDWDGVEVVE